MLTGWRVTVGPGGQAGAIRPRFGTGSTEVLGDVVQLPAEPGTYEFPSPHLREGYLVALDQFTGGHAIVRRQACRAENVSGDACDRWAVLAFGGDPPPGVGESPDELIEDGQLAAEAVYENDDDADGLGDQSADRTNLSVALATAPDATGGLRVGITVTNHGPLTADQPGVAMTFPALFAARWDQPCVKNLRMALNRLPSGSSCAIEALPAGASRTLTFTTRDGGTIEARAFAEGPDVAPADNTATLRLIPPPPWELKVAPKQRLANGIVAKVRMARAGRVRVSVRFRVNRHWLLVTRTVKVPAATEVTVPLRPTGAKLRSLRRALASEGSLSGLVLLGVGDMVIGPGQRVRVR